MADLKKEIDEMPNKIGQLILESTKRTGNSRCGYGEGTTFFVPISEDEPACSYAESIRAHEASSNDD